MHILERVQPFYIFHFPQKKSQNSNEVKNGCNNSRVRIDGGQPMLLLPYTRHHNPGTLDLKRLLVINRTDKWGKKYTNCGL